jgi:hypothetical protein
MNWRKPTWAVIVWTGLMVLWLASLGSNAHCAYLDDACHAHEVGNYTVVVVLWVVVVLPLVVIWYRSRSNPRPCPVCATNVPAGMTQCSRCGYSFWASTEGSNVPPPPAYLPCWQCQAPVMRGQPVCTKCGAQLVWPVQPRS